MTTNPINKSGAVPMKGEYDMREFLDWLDSGQFMRNRTRILNYAVMFIIGLAWGILIARW